MSSRLSGTMGTIFMTTFELIKKRRTIRKFKQKKIPEKILINCLEAARLAPSSRNQQPLEYILITKNLEKVFKTVGWAADLKDGEPKKNEKPTAYILVVANKDINPNCQHDVGLAVENIILTALENNVASCILGSADKEKLSQNFNIPQSYQVELVVALGYPAHKSIAEESNGKIKYWIDENEVWHIPKRRLEDIIHKEKF